MNGTIGFGQSLLESTFAGLDQALLASHPNIEIEEIGTIQSVDSAIITAAGLRGVQFEEMIALPNSGLGMAFDLRSDQVGIILLKTQAEPQAGTQVTRTRQVLSVPVGESLLGRVVDPLGNPLDRSGDLGCCQSLPIERSAPAITDRAPVTVPLQTGLKVIDALIPVGRGQRELILGDRQTGKTAIALDTILNQKDQDVICIYCAIGQRTAAVAKLIADLERYGAMDYSIVVVASGDDPPGLQYITPYAATSIGEYFMAQGRDVLIVYDDLTRHARAYRELALLLRRPPGREAFPGDIFYLHSRLLERSTHLKPELGGGSLTALPIVETEAQNLSAYIPTNIISITDGQIYVSSELVQRGIFPGVDVGKSVSRVGGKAQLPAFRAVVGDLRLSYTQFEELEIFSRFGTRLDEHTRQVLERGRRVRVVLTQPQYRPISAASQLIVLLAASRGLLDPIPISQIFEVESVIQATVKNQAAGIGQRILAGESLSQADLDHLLEIGSQVVTQWQEENTHGDPGES